jgi:hypothetical protein
MTNNNPTCTCRGARLGACHSPRTGHSTRDIMAIVARQSRPALRGTADNQRADYCRNVADQHHDAGRYVG